MNAQEEIDQALRDAAALDDLKSCRAALFRGATVTAVDPRGDHALERACYWDHVDMVRLLLEQKDAKKATNIANWSGWTPLHTAAAHGEIEIMMLLLEHGALRSLNATTDQGRTPLMSASYGGGNSECVLFLLQAGADPSLTDTDGDTAREYAILETNLHIVALLDNFADFVSKRLPTLAIVQEELEGIDELFIPREIINLFLASSFRFSF